jgi:hypothetical protein
MDGLEYDYKIYTQHIQDCRRRMALDGGKARYPTASTSFHNTHTLMRRSSSCCGLCQEDFASYDFDIGFKVILRDRFVLFPDFAITICIIPS